MTVTYTTADIVKKRVKNISSSLADSDIEENILQAESIIDSVMKRTARGTSPDFTFDSSKHGIIRDCATNYAAYLCVIYDPSEFPSMETAEMVANLLWNAVQNALNMLSDSRFVEYLASL
ncbi:MAG: hypothetical protein DRP85_05480 [Candidatus Makaraimicrobium thalassicum]|nr:MAG: hypothetical protein DRP85_05480 [Candidatus Omnitrophota bacterium]